MADPADARDHRRSNRTCRSKLPAIFLLAGLFFLLLMGCGDSIVLSGAKVPLYTASLVINEHDRVAIAQLKRLQKLQYLDIRSQEISLRQYIDLQQALPACEILWKVPLGESRVDSDSVSIALPDITKDSASLLCYLPNLQEIDATGTRDYALVKELAALYPQYTFHWTVTLGAQSWRNDVQSISITMRPADEGMIESALSGFSNLKKVDLTNTPLPAKTVSGWKAKYSAVAFRYMLTIANAPVASDAEAIDLHDNGAVTLAVLQDAIPQFPQLMSVDVRGCDLSSEEKLSLVSEFPGIQFIWTVEVLPGITASSADTELILSNHIVSDPDRLADDLALLPSLQSVEMCSCGLSNEQMQSLRDRFPKIKFVWLIRVGEWEMRTDVRAFSMANVKGFPGGWLVGDEYLRYHRFTADSLAELKYCTDLIALDIGHASNVLDLSNLASLDTLQYLVVAMTRAHDIEVLRNMPNLVYLEIFSMPITDLSPLLACTKLEYLNCGNCKFKSADVLVQLTNLKRLWVINSMLPDAEIAKLRAALPDTVIKTNGAHPTDNGWRTRNEKYYEMQELYHIGHF